jgi:hypothetical protein
VFWRQKNARRKLIYFIEYKILNAQPQAETLTLMDKKEAKIYCLNKNCSLFEKDLPTGLAFIFCPRCTRKLFKEDGANRKKTSQINNTNNNNNNTYSVRARRDKNFNNSNNNRKQQNIPLAPSPNGTICGQPDPTVLMLFDKMLSIISNNAK